MLTKGAETYRVEDTLERILATAKESDLQTFVTPTGIFLSLKTKDGSYQSSIRRTEVTGIDLGIIEGANELSRRYCDGRLDLPSAMAQLKEISGQARYSSHTVIAATSAAAGLFAIVFGGSLTDGLITLVAGFVLALFQSLFKKPSISKFFINLLGGFISAATALTLIHVTGLPAHQNIILISVVMPLVPGVAITNAIRDTIHGHLTSGNARILDAFIIATSIAAGVGMALSLFNGLIGGVIL